MLGQPARWRSVSSRALACLNASGNSAAWHSLQEARTSFRSPPSASDRAIAIKTLDTQGNARWWSPQGFLSRGFAATATATASTTTPAAAPVDTLQVGQLYDATVKSVMRTKVILDVQNTLKNMHRREVSKERVEDMNTVFQPGEQIKVLVRGRHAIKGSYVCTRHLEPEPGLILRDKEAVWAAAEQQAAAFRANGEKKLVERNALLARLQVGQTVDAQVMMWLTRGKKLAMVEGHVVAVNFARGTARDMEMQKGQTIQLRVQEKRLDNSPNFVPVNNTP